MRINPCLDTRQRVHWPLPNTRASVDILVVYGPSFEVYPVCSSILRLRLLEDVSLT